MAETERAVTTFNIPVYDVTLSDASTNHGSFADGTSREASISQDAVPQDWRDDACTSRYGRAC